MNVVKLVDEVKDIKEQIRKFTTMDLRDQNYYVMKNNRNNSSSSTAWFRDRRLPIALTAIPDFSANLSEGGAWQKYNTI